jgi:hypothetical protein
MQERKNKRKKKKKSIGPPSPITKSPGPVGLDKDDMPKVSINLKP